MASEKPPLIIVAGPTASGKSALGLELARQLNGIIISADSRQIYRDFDIGTAKPTPEERAEVPHRLIDVADPRDVYTAARFQHDAREAIAQTHAEGKLPIMVGGTGLYIRSALGGFSLPHVPPNPELRAELEALPDAHALLAEVDPEAARRIHPNDRVRTIRALEVWKLTGRPISAQQASEESPYDVTFLALGWERDRLYERINERTLQMIDQGLVAEVQELERRYGADLPLLETLGYAEIRRMLRGELSMDEAVELIQRHTRNYAKRQMTWFRREPGVQWLEPERHASMEDLVADARRRIEDTTG